MNKLFTLIQFRIIKTSKMNLTNTTESNIQYWAIDVTYILETYVIRVAGGIGVLLNALYFKILLDKRLKHKIYDFFLCRVLCSAIVCLFGVGNISKCFTCESDSYWFLIYQYYISGIGIRMALFASLISDIFLILNRYLQMTKRNSPFWKQISKKLIMFLSLSLPILGVWPGFIAVEIVKQPNGLYVKKLTNFGLSKAYTYYLVVLFMLETVIPIGTILVLNVLSVVKFRKQTRIHRNLTRQQQNDNKVENRYTKLVIILTTICIISRFFDMATGLLYRLQYLDPSMISKGQILLITFSMSLSNLVLFIIHGEDGLIYFKMDRNLWRLSLAMLGLKKVNIFIFKSFQNIKNKFTF